MEPQDELTAGQKAAMYFKSAGAFARNPKALVALVKYKIDTRRQSKQADTSGPAAAIDPEGAAPQNDQTP